MSETSDRQWNGISVDPPKVYDERTLELQLFNLAGRLSLLSGIDQNTLIARIGSQQGAAASQMSANLSIMGPPIPSVSTVATTGTPSTVATQVPAASGGGYTTTGQTVTTPSNTTAVTTNNAAITPSTPTAPASSVTLPTAYNVSSLDALNEEMQLSSQLIQTQMLLEGSPADSATVKGNPKRRITLGFPISVETPKEFIGDAAEIEVAICDPDIRTESTPPTLVNILPQEKTYNVASISNNSLGFGAGGVVGGVISVGGSFLWGHQTYYLVRAQDTVALRHPRGEATAQFPACPVVNGKAAPEALTFAWQFRPVLGRKTIEQGMRQTFAQVSLAPGDEAPGSTTRLQISVRTCWRKYDSGAGIVNGEAHGHACHQTTFNDVPIVRNPGLTDVAQDDNGDGSATVTVSGYFPLGTKLFLGDASATDGSTGYFNNGHYVKFTAPYQTLAVRGARLQLPDGTELPIVKGQDAVGPFYTSTADRVATIPGQFDPKSTLLLDNEPVAGVVIDADGLHFPIPPGPSDLRSLEIVRPDGSRIEAVKLAAAGGSMPIVTVFGDFPDSIRGPGKLLLNGHKIAGMTLDRIGLHFPVQAGAETLPQGLAVMEGPKPCYLPSHSGAWDGAAAAPYSDTAVLLTVDTTKLCPNLGQSTYRYPPYLVIAGKAYGLPDSPFRSTQGGILTVVVPKTALQTQTPIRLKRLFLGEDFTVPFQLPDWDPASSATLALVSSNAKTSTFAVTGVQVRGASILTPAPVPSTVRSETLLTFDMPTPTAKLQKVVYLLNQAGETTPLTMPDIPDAKAAKAKPVLKLTGSLTIPVGATAQVAISGSNLQLISSVKYPKGRLLFRISPDGKQLLLTAPLPADFVGSAGTVPLTIGLTDKTETIYKVTIK